MNQKTVIVIAGPTAVGKTELAIRLADHFNTEIISADSRQCFKELTIGVAKPSAEELNAVPHHFIDSHSIQDPVNAVVFENYALACTEKLFSKKDLVIVAGGTGLYIRAFLQGMDEMPAIDPALRQQLIIDYAEKGLGWLQREIRLVDPAFASAGEMLNPHRLLRAYEIFLTTGKSIRELQQGKIKQRPFRVLKYALQLNKPELYNRINTRVDQMIVAGLVEEVKSLQEFKELPPLQTVGYKELFHYIDGFSSLPDAIEEIKKNTRRYAKRQLTWFRKEEGYNWFTRTDLPVIMSDIEGKLKNL